MLKGDNAGAKEAYVAGAQIAPDNADAHFLLSNAMERMGDAKGAATELTTFVQLAPAQDPRLATAKEKLKTLGE